MSLGSPAALSVLPITSRDLAMADSANYYVAVTPTPGTGIISAGGTSLVSTTPSLVVFNSGLLNVYLIYLRLGSTVVGGGAAFHNYSHSVDVGNRYTSGGTALTINNTNSLANAKSSVIATWGALTATTATTNERKLGNDWFRSGADVVGDVYEFQYGSPVGGATSGTQVATVMNTVRSTCPIVLQPQSSYILNLWATTNTQGVTMEVQLAFCEK